MNATHDWDLSFTYRTKHFTLACELTLNLNRVSIRGPSGTGKSSFADILLGLRHTKDLQGRARFGDKIIFDTTTGQYLSKTARPFSWLPQTIQLFPHLSVLENMLITSEDDQDNALFSLVAEELELADKLTRRPHVLSLGEKQRVGLARALLNPKPIIVLDEPLASQDDLKKKKAMKLIAHILDSKKKSLILISHDLGEAKALCNCFLEIKENRISLVL